MFEIESSSVLSVGQGPSAVCVGASPFFAVSNFCVTCVVQKVVQALYH